jgi:replicative DNA helicase
MTDLSTVTEKKKTKSQSATSEQEGRGSQDPSVGSESFSLETERLVIGVMLNPERSTLHMSLMNLIAPEDFFVEQHQTVWRIISQMRESGIECDPVAVIDKAKQMREFIGGASYIAEAVQDPVARFCSDESVNAASGRIKEFSIARKFQTALVMATTLARTGQTFDTVSRWLDDEIINIRGLAKTSRSGPVGAHVFYDAYLEKMDRKLSGEEVKKGASTGFPELDNILGGELSKESLVILAGRPGMGKSAFATAIEQNISGSGSATLFFSLEMTGIDLAQRNLARHSRVEFKNIKSVNLADSEINPIIESAGILGSAPCYIDETPGLSMSEIRSRSRTFIEAHPDGVIFVDYLQIVQPGRDSKSKDPRYVVSETSQSLVQLARELKCPIVALAQLNRQVDTRANKRPGMADLRESGQLEQDASVIMFLYRDEYYNKETTTDPNVTEVIVAKNRNGEAGTVKFHSDLSRMHYLEMGRFETEEA